MSTIEKNQKRLNNILTYALILSTVWTLLIAVFLGWNKTKEKNAVKQAAKISARSQFTRDVLYRKWNAMHGGVYVETSESVQPNPYLTQIDNRDIKLPSGRSLTLINPAYMTRQVHELGFKTHNVQGHITSLKPIRPENAPDHWETQALSCYLYYKQHP